MKINFGGRIFVGTSGWSYNHWRGLFYPLSLSHSQELSYFSRSFSTVEINYSFYHLPTIKSFQRWYSLTPPHFVFALKVSRFITHIKRLNNIGDAWEEFLSRAVVLKEKLGPLLLQFPPSFKFSATNFQRLEKFLDYNHVLRKQTKIALEFRNENWFRKEVYSLSRNYDFAIVFSYSSLFPNFEISKGSFFYLRLHGPNQLFSSSYSASFLKGLAQKIKKWSREKLIYCYFNNDYGGYALKNAQELISYLS